MSWEDNLTKAQKANVERIKQGEFYEQMIALGLTPFTKEWAAYRYKLNSKTPKARATRNKRRKEKYYANYQEVRTNENIRKRKSRNKNKERYNKSQREYYAKEREQNAAKQCARRHKREPHRDIRSATSLYNSGLLSDERYVERVSKAIEHASELNQKTDRRRNKPTSKK